MNRENLRYRLEARDGWGHYSNVAPCGAVPQDLTIDSGLLHRAWDLKLIEYPGRDFRYHLSGVASVRLGAKGTCTSCPAFFAAS